MKSRLYICDSDILNDIENIIDEMVIYDYHNLIKSLKGRNDTEYHLEILRYGKYHTHIIEYLKSKYEEDKRYLENS